MVLIEVIVAVFCPLSPLFFLMQTEVAMDVALR